MAAVTPEIKTLIADMTETMWHQVGIGLAAPQVGAVAPHPRHGRRQGRGAGHRQPDRHRARGRREGGRGLPVPARASSREVERSKSLAVEGLDGDGQPISFEAQGLQAKIIQHELDHLDGVLFIDRLPPVTRDRIKKKIQKEGLAPKGRRHHAFAL